MSNNPWRAASVGLLPWILAAFAWAIVQSLLQGFVGCEPIGSLKPGVIFWNFVFALLYAVPTAFVAGAVVLSASFMILKRGFAVSAVRVSTILSLVCLLLASMAISIVIFRDAGAQCVGT
jgi:hypothetical protein